MIELVAPAECLIKLGGQTRRGTKVWIEIDLAKDALPQQNREGAKSAGRLDRQVDGILEGASDQQLGRRFRGIAVNFWFPLQFGSTIFAGTSGIVLANSFRKHR